MKPNPLTGSIGMRMFNAPTDNATPSAVPAAASPTGQDIPTVSGEPAPNKGPNPGQINIAKELGLPQAPQPRAMSPSQLLGKRAMSKAPELKKGEPARGPDGKFVQRTAANPTGKPTEAQPEPIEPGPPVATVVPPKFKIGNREMTEAEVTAHIKSLEDKAKIAETPKEAPKAVEAQKAPEAPAETPEQAATAQRQRDLDFINGAVPQFNPDDLGMQFGQPEWDNALATGDVKFMHELLARTQARSELNARKWMADQVGPKLAALEQRLDPLAKLQTEAAQHMTEAQFLDANPDIKAHPEGMQTFRDIDAAFHRKYDKAQKMIAANIADADDLEFVRDFEAKTPAEYHSDVAYYAKQKLGINGAQTSAPAQPAGVPPTEQPKPVVPRPTPPKGQAPGGNGAPQATSKAAATIALLHQHRA